ncbi:uncharacterized protein EI97DRAFT_445938 [Westerdykella ornata]|uniref:Uncharacterized protein n=1 Tax=Westerdykella ornata TaxID=318751 RepID=A0A6A6JAL7_WESOR|nr:uncharacterized protein EI97DRAFT_445938 [Westerdykella ornata]KAF2272239.1 hypothetical protein EI97DRAFT_445938 [Westerdykella ornata]
MRLTCRPAVISEWVASLSAECSSNGRDIKSAVSTDNPLFTYIHPEAITMPTGAATATNSSSSASPTTPPISGDMPSPTTTTSTTPPLNAGQKGGIAAGVVNFTVLALAAAVLL